MPLYEYECGDCGRRFERLQKFSDPPVEVCPLCGGLVRKLISSAAIQFKGSGWYVTDYAQKAKSEPAKTDSSTGTDGGTSDTAKSSTPGESSSSSTSSTETAGSSTKQS